MVSKERVDACSMCYNAHVEPELTSDNDFSACGIGECEAGYRIFFLSGCARPTRVTFEKWEEKRGWAAIGCYCPRFCPNCGRRLFENGL